MLNPDIQGKLRLACDMLRSCKAPTPYLAFAGKEWRRGWDSNPRMEVLQTSPLGLLGTAPNVRQYIENRRAMSA